MKAFNVIVRKNGSYFAYVSINACSVDAIDEAIDRFGVCAVTVRARP